LGVARSSVYTVLETLLYLLVVVAVVSIAVLGVGRRARRSDNAENQCERYQSAAKYFSHVSSPLFDK
jgi:hypothetical protein